MGSDSVTRNKRDLVEAAVEFYLNAQREKMQACGSCTANSTAATRHAFYDYVPCRRTG